MQAVDRLMLEAKQALLMEQQRRFQALREEGRSEEAMQQLSATLSCAADLLSQSLVVLNQVLAEQRKRDSEGVRPPDCPPGPHMP